jgi:hypothetical protein
MHSVPYTPTTFRFAAHRTGANRRAFRLGLVVVILLLSAVYGPTQTPPPAEHQVKAAIVANLAKYVDWPSHAFASSNSPLVLVVIAPPPLEDELRRMTAGKAVEGHALDLQRADPKSGHPPAAHILFLSGMDRKQAAEMLRACQGQPVLTVVDASSDAPEGAIITLVRKNNTVRLEINTAAAKECQLGISSKLLSVADTTKGRGR